MLALQNLAVLRRHDLDEPRLIVIPVVQNSPGKLAFSVLIVARDKHPHLTALARIVQWFELDHSHVAAALEVACRIQHVRYTAAHSSREVASGATQDDHHASRHVLASVVAHSLDDRDRATVAHGKAFSRNAAEIGFAAGCAVQSDVADQDVIFRFERGCSRRAHNDETARKPLADIVVSVSFQIKGYSACQESTEALARRPLDVNLDRVRGQPLLAVAARNFRRQHRTERAVDVANRHMDLHGPLVLQSAFAKLDKAPVSDLVELVVLLLNASDRHLSTGDGAMENLAEIDVARFPVVDSVVRLQTFDPTHHLVNRPEAELSHVFAHFLSDKHHQIHDVFGLARKTLSQHGVLSCDPYRAGVEMAHSHHHTSHRDQSGGRKAELFGAQQGGDDDVATSFEVTVDLEPDAPAQVVHHEHLLRLRQAELPRDARVLDRTLG